MFTLIIMFRHFGFFLLKGSQSCLFPVSVLHSDLNTPLCEIKREPQFSACHGGPNRVGLNETLRIYVPLCWVEYRLRWTIWFLLLMFFNTEHLKASNQKLHNDHSLERIHQESAFTAAGFIFSTTSVLRCLPVSSILFPTTITKAIRNLTHQIVLFYNNLVATCKTQDKTVQFLMWNIWKLWKLLGRDMH